MSGNHITLANPFKTRIIAEAQVKTDKIDARILALLLRAGLVSSVHIPCKETRQRKEVMRQRCFFVKQRTMLRNRIHRLLGAQHDLKLPVVSDLFGKKGMSLLEKIELPSPAGLLLKQQLVKDARHLAQDGTPFPLLASCRGLIKRLSLFRDLPRASCCVPMVL